ncbi:G-type lectin S-receptor-like serine/threonine-protein kinase At4g27290 [Salvia miltiorrhiza]|uniref:G-type lectin S-receptor-like serine/threonine-protein kinase At4g27290 n=1 Tax=Salvia miltiorrhiza TaxID=226208 RepID=UPI0025AC1F2A|nr:G-type lectin S-receptor-like serine/threonine-protein kinase At4g27290 [Salvia miltiorrhiza]
MNMICSSRFSLCLFLFTTSFFSIHTTDTIDTSQTVSDSRDDTLISSNGAFALGFYSPGSSKNRYVGIWYNNIKDKTVVWVANRDNPLTDRSGTLRVIEPGGRLLLLNATNATIWAANVSSSGVHTPVARLLDSGNLIVTDANDEKNIVWQSFDYPTDTFLPGMKLGKNFVTGHEVYIASAKNNDDPATGSFTYQIDPTGYPQSVIKDGASVRCKSGPWNGVRFSGSHNLVKNIIFTFGLVINKDEVYYHYTLLNDSVYMRFKLSESGEGQRWLWSYQTQIWLLYHTIPTDNCDIYSVCGAYGVCNTKTSPYCSCLNKFEPNDPRGWGGDDFSNGCIRRTPLHCQDGDVFLKYSGVKLPDTERSWSNASMSLQECKVACSKNCSCTAYASLNISNGESGCLLWFSELVNMREISPGQDIYIRMAKSELDSGSRKRGILIVTLSVVMGILVLGLSLKVLYSRKRKEVDHQLQLRGRLRSNYMDYHLHQSREDLDLPVLDLSSIIKATDHFSNNNKLGEGGFGPVYKGLLEDGVAIAVKRLSRTSHQGMDEFKNEVICIAKLQHRNLVKLLGYCIEEEEMMLVYEYMTNKSLDLILFDPEKSILLDWPRRFNIINGIARGLMYLHQDSRLRVIHRDLKASNILLDSDMNPKISDFGLARTFRGNEIGANTNRVVGTYGYMSPEYAGDGIFSVKSDVFSFGVIVLEIVSGKRNRRFCYGDEQLNFLGYAWMLNREEKSVELIDSCIRESCNVSQALRSIHVGLLCVQQHPDDRPTMSSVVQTLSNDAMILPQPKHPGFFIQREMIETKISATSSTGSCTNRITTTSVLEGR